LSVLECDSCEGERKRVKVVRKHLEKFGGESLIYKR
jgi:hypothetical protein